MTNPELPNFAENIQNLGQITKEDTQSYAGYLRALQNRRQYFKEVGGAIATDHGFPSAYTVDLDPQAAEKLFHKALAGDITAADAEIFRGHMLMKMTEMSIDDGLVMQIHPGVARDHNPFIFEN